MRIARIDLEQFGPFDAAAIDIPAPVAGQRGELVIFEGPNGSGKSAILQAIACSAAKPHLGGAPLDLWPLWTREPIARDPAADGFALMPPLRDVLQHLRTPKGAAYVTIEDDGASFRSTVGREGVAWAKEAEGSKVAERIEAIVSAAAGTATKLHWAAFAYKAHLSAPPRAAEGPAEIDAPPLRGALSFGTFAPVSTRLEELVTNIVCELESASAASLRPASGDRGEVMACAPDERQRRIDRIEDAMSEATGRAIHFEFPFAELAPKILIDGEKIPLSRIGEGMRRTLAWLSDLLIRLQRIAWARPMISPLDQDFWLILDDIDEGLHPTAQARILPALRRLFPNARFYVATHSPFLIASAGEGLVLSLRPDNRRRVTLAVPARRLEPGQSLEWVMEEVFSVETGFIDPATRSALAAHRRDINRLRRSKESLGAQDWNALLERRAKLLGLNEEVQSVVAMLEVPVRAVIEARVVSSTLPPDEVGE
jgi:hypothetical protein